MWWQLNEVRHLILIFHIGGTQQVPFSSPHCVIVGFTAFSLLSTFPSFPPPLWASELYPQAQEQGLPQCQDTLPRELVQVHQRRILQGHTQIYP